MGDSALNTSTTLPDLKSDRGAPPPIPADHVSSSSSTTISSSASSVLTDIFRVGIRLELPLRENVSSFSHFTLGEINIFALSLEKSEDLVFLSDHQWSTSGEAASWCIKRIPWFKDPLRRITALSFDDEGTLYVGTLDGSLHSLKSLHLLSDQRPPPDIVLLYRLLHKITQILVYSQDTNKILVCVGSHGNLALVSGQQATPINVTFTCGITRCELFQNKVGVTCALVCLENGQNVYTVLDDLEPAGGPAAPGEGSQKKSIFKKAKDNLMSRLSEDKLPFFGAKRQKTDSIDEKSAPVTTQGSVGVKFQALEELCKGELKKVHGRNQFCRHAGNKLDIFDDDFRQVSTIHVPGHVNTIFPISRLYYLVDSASHAFHVSILTSSTFFHLAVIPFLPKILSIYPMGSPSSSSVFIIASDGVYEVTLRQDPIPTCVAFLLRDSSAPHLEAICNALNVSKKSVCETAGDIKADEGRFSKSILFYKLAGLTYTQISAKFGSKGLMAAMLFFFELVDQEKTKLYGGYQDKLVMSDLALLGRIEQYLRHGGMPPWKVPDNPKNHGHSLKKMITQNIWFSSARATEWLSDAELLWAVKQLTATRQCYPELLAALWSLSTDSLGQILHLNLGWKLITADWMALYTMHPQQFLWFRQICKAYLKVINNNVLMRLLTALTPWRRELQRKIFTEISDPDNSLMSTVSLNDYVELFTECLLEALRRTSEFNTLPSYTYKVDAKQVQRLEIQNHKSNMIATLMLSFTWSKLLAANQSHVLCVRNGKVYAWGENKWGRCGISPEGSEERLQFHVPTMVSMSPSLKLNVDSVCAGANHSVALTSAGTLLVWGQNNYGQCGLGTECQWVSRPLALDIPDVIFTNIAAGSYHTVAVDHLNRVWTWGWGVHGQLGNGTIDNVYTPKLIHIQEKIVAVSAGHSHTAFLTCFGRVLVTGCNHFGQLGVGSQGEKVKTPKFVTELPPGTLIRLVECGTSSTVLVSTKNRLFYSGLNPATLKSLLSSSRRSSKKSPTAAPPPELDFTTPTAIDTSHMAGDIHKVNCASTHFAVMSTLGYVYTWGVGKSGQLCRPDDSTKSLELIYSADEKIFNASDICCAGDCTFVVEKETGCLFGCGFNSCGQLGRMESDEDQAVMMIRTKKRVVKVRQPSNIYFKLREIPGLPKQHSWENDNGVAATTKVCPESGVINQELLEWVIKAFRRNYDSDKMIENCVKAENFKAASILETMAENHEQALQHNLAASESKKDCNKEAINKYLNSIEHTNNPSVEQACRFLNIVIHHWQKFGLSGELLEEILEEERLIPKWGTCLCSAVKEIVSLADESAEWIAGNLTPVFILQCVKNCPDGIDETSCSSSALQTSSHVNGTLSFGTVSSNNLI